jgi:hypothetical protein
MNWLTLYIIGLIIIGIAIGDMFQPSMGFLTIGIGLALVGFIVFMYSLSNNP